MTRLCIIQYNKYNLQERDKYQRIFFFINNNKKLKYNLSDYPHYYHVGFYT